LRQVKGEVRVKKFFVLSSIALFAALMGCAGPAGYHGVTATNGAIYTSLNVPSSSHSATVFEAQGPGYTTMGVVEAEGSATNILGIISTGDTAYKTLLDKAKAGGAETVVDVYYDAKILDILGLYCKVDLHLYGTGVKWKK
jgi:hypothetical protein